MRGILNLTLSEIIRALHWSHNFWWACRFLIKFIYHRKPFYGYKWLSSLFLKVLNLFLLLVDLFLAISNFSPYSLVFQFCFRLSVSVKYTGDRSFVTILSFVFLNLVDLELAFEIFKPFLHFFLFKSWIKWRYSRLKYFTTSTASAIRVFFQVRLINHYLVNLFFSFSLIAHSCAVAATTETLKPSEHLLNLKLI